MVSESTPVPTPLRWTRLYERLLSASRAESPVVVPPPVPLILAGAAFSSAADIRQRWLEMIRWANQYGYSALLAENLGEPPDHDVAERISGVGENGKPYIAPLQWGGHEPIQRPTVGEEEANLNKLVADWDAIAGSDLSMITAPYRFTGRKRRGLLVWADPANKPPWGSWSWITKRPETFRELRRSVNAALTPFAVDDISFRCGRWPPERTARIPAGPE